jgi:ABC-2 type transport system ATP-binding protein
LPATPRHEPVSGARSPIRHHGLLSMSTTDAHHLPDRTDQSRKARARLRDGPVAIEVRGLSKTFRIPEHRVDSLKERVVHPFTRAEYRMLDALRDVSFDVHRGEFFGIVGRNGSGKSTLLKILASIYRADGGRVRMAGRVAPFIELGVGFNPEMTAKENVTLNGVLFGLTRRESARMLDAVLDFAELGEFAELKIKNYSSGMMVRLAFAIMVQADADIMLIDEVLAVGDAAFGQKCMDVFYERRAAGKTIVLVTHDMTTVQDMCDRAVVIHDGELQYCGDPEQAAMRYMRLNFAGVDPAAPPTERPVALEFNARLEHAQLLDATGTPAANLEQDAPLIVDIAMTASRELVEPIFVFHVRNVDGVVVFAFSRTLGETVAEGERIRFRGEIENRLVPGSYTLECWVRQDRQTGDMALQPMRLCTFVVYGTAPRHGLVSLQADLDMTVEREP